jgi:hypothetical protein
VDAPLLLLLLLTHTDLTLLLLLPPHHCLGTRLLLLPAGLHQEAGAAAQVVVLRLAAGTQDTLRSRHIRRAWVRRSSLLRHSRGHMPLEVACRMAHMGQEVDLHRDLQGHRQLQLSCWYGMRISRSGLL